MVWKNPFQLKNSEEQIREVDFLTLFDCTALQMINPNHFTKSSFVSSTPGAGKTSLFRAFTPKILNTIIAPEHKDTYKEIYKQMEKLGVINNGKVILASAFLSCALNYSIIDEMFQNGRCKQVFFALLNYRIAIVLLRGIGNLLDISTDDYYRITFSNIPQEMISEEENFVNGKTIYAWACRGERDLCRYLDSDRNETLDISFVHTSLLMIRLFEPQNILFDGNQYFEKTLIIFDDFHKLSYNQKKYLSEAIYTLKTTTGVWFGQRLEGVSNTQIISMDGSLNRDYNQNIIIDNYWSESSKAFYKMLQSIADRRVKEAAIGNCHNFADCIDSTVEEKKYFNVLKDYIDEIYRNLSHKTKVIYQDILNHIDKADMKIMEKAIWFECIIIKENRRNWGQLTFFDDTETVESFISFVKDNEKSAAYYICCKCKIPYYIGINNLCVLSSYNVQQFLVFAGEYFDCYRIKSLDKKKSLKRIALDAEEQEKILRKVLIQRWNDMDLRYADINIIKTFLNNIAKFGFDSRDSERNSYSGGAYTGIGIDSSVLKKSIQTPEYELLVKTLGECLSSKYLERRDINNGEIIVFYLNRWLCAYYGLPIAYGGWKKCSMNTALQMCEAKFIKTDDEYDDNFSLL